MFITFEGIEGCGKSTQIDRIEKTLNQSGIPVLKTFEPGGTGIGMKIRRILLDSRNKNLTPLAELILYIADRAQHMEEVIRPALGEGKWVLCDRFFDATIVYQGAARGQDMAFIHALNQEVTQGIRPDITFILDCPVEMGLKRALKRNEASSEQSQDRFEKEKIEFHCAVREGYLDIAAREPERAIVIDAALSQGEVERAIFDHIKPFLGKD